jgi:cohesin complex subunit SCC1
MFFDITLLKKGSPMAKLWLAAHQMQKKLNKAQVDGTDIAASCDYVTSPAAPLALRLSGQLLLGIVRIYARQARYLDDDASDTMTKMKNAFKRDGVVVVDAAAAAITGASHVITLPDNFDDVDLDLPDIPIDQYLDDVADGGEVSNRERNVGDSCISCVVM